jgi:hypothetical protein
MTTAMISSRRIVPSAGPVRSTHQVRKSAGVLLERGDLGFRVVDAKLAARRRCLKPQLEVRHNATFAASELVPALAERAVDLIQ